MRLFNKRDKLFEQLSPDLAKQIQTALMTGNFDWVASDSFRVYISKFDNQELNVSSKEFIILEVK